LSKVFVDIAIAAATIVRVDKVAVICIRYHMFQGRLAALAALFTHVENMLFELTNMFNESAEAHAVAGRMPRSTVNLKQFEICAIVTRCLIPRIVCMPLGGFMCMCARRVYRTLNMLCVTAQEASVLVTRLGACINRRPSRFPIRWAPGARYMQMMVHRIDQVTLRVQVYFSALLIEHGLNVRVSFGDPRVPSDRGVAGVS